MDFGPSRQLAMYGRKLLAQKGRLRTLSSTFESRKFKLGEDKATKRPRWAYYIYTSSRGIPCNISWRGLSMLLILRESNAVVSALYIERRYFLSVTYLIISRYTKIQT